MISPTPGRVVWYHPERQHSEPWAAIICKVIDDTHVNLFVISDDGVCFPKQMVTLVQDETAAPARTDYAEWMPYQKGQAAKAEEAEKELEELMGGKS
jgi:hypothetical protein